jgi:uncharacterized protein
MTGRRQPQRMCVGCRSKTEKRALFRVVRSPEGRVTFDRTGRAPGRGAYVHSSSECLKLAFRRGAIARALHVSLGETEAARLIEELSAVGDEG